MQNSPSAITELVKAHRARHVLEILHDQPGGMSNSDILLSCAKLHGMSCTRTVFEAELQDLAELGLLNLRRESQCLVLILTERGAEVAEGVATSESVARKAPEF